MKQQAIKLTKKQYGMLWMYTHSDCVTFEGYNGAYKSASIAKHAANRNCLADYDAHHGFKYRYCGHNCFFTFAYLYHNIETDTINLRYHTHANVYDFPLVSAEHYFKTHELTEDGEYHV